jgi:hypothetical protein
MDYSWIIEEPTDVTVIILTSTVDVLRVDRVTPYDGDYNIKPKTAVVVFDVSDGDGKFTIDGQDQDLGDYYATFLGMFEEIAVTNNKPGQKIAMNGWKDGGEVLHP